MGIELKLEMKLAFKQNSKYTLMGVWSMRMRNMIFKVRLGVKFGWEFEKNMSYTLIWLGIWEKDKIWFKVIINLLITLTNFSLFLNY